MDMIRQTDAGRKAGNGLYTAGRRKTKTTAAHQQALRRYGPFSVQRQEKVDGETALMYLSYPRCTRDNTPGGV